MTSAPTASLKIRELPELGGRKLASNTEEYLLLELLPSVANGFLRKRRKEEFEAEESVKAPAAEEAPAETAEPITGPVIAAPMSGRVVSINVKPGQEVKPGDTVLVYEAMKMENDIESEISGIVKRVLVSVDDQVATDTPLIEFEN